MAKKIVKKRPRRNVKPQVKPVKPGRIAKAYGKVRWFFVEMVKVYSNDPSYFSKKRIESGIGFIIAQWGMIFWLIAKINVMDTYDFAIWASMEFLVAGYMVKQIQKQKEFETYSEEPCETEYNEDYSEPENYDGDNCDEEVPYENYDDDSNDSHHHGGHHNGDRDDEDCDNDRPRNHRR